LRHSAPRISIDAIAKQESVLERGAAESPPRNGHSKDPVVFRSTMPTRGRSTQVLLHPTPAEFVSARIVLILNHQSWH
jgi:hypothetical protein